MGQIRQKSTSCPSLLFIYLCLGLPDINMTEQHKSPSNYIVSRYRGGKSRYQCFYVGKTESVRFLKRTV